MTISQPRVQLLNRTLTSTAEVTTPAFVLHPSATAMAFFVLCSENGAYEVDIRMSNGQWYLYNGGTGTTTANQVSGIFPVAAGYGWRLRFTPDAAPAVTVINAAYSGHGQPT